MKTAIVRLLLTWVALVTLLAATLALAYLPLGAFKPVAAYGIATVKAGVILWFFMELRREHALLRLAASAGFFWTSVLLILLTGDYLAR